MSYWFWTIICSLVMLWYITVTIIVAFKGSVDIREMLDKLKDSKSDVV